MVKTQIMKNLFSVGTDALKSEIISDKFSQNYFFYKLIDMAPALRIKDWCNITSYEKNQFAIFQKKVCTECHDIHQLFLLAYKLCQNYNFFPYFYTSYRKIMPILETRNELTNQVDIYNELARYYVLPIGKQNLSFIKSHASHFKKELEIFLLLSSTYTYSRIPPITNTVSNAIIASSMNSHSNKKVITEARKVAHKFAIQKNSFIHDGLSFLENSQNKQDNFPNYIGTYIYPDIFNAPKRSHIQLDSIYDFIVLNSLTKKQNNPFFQLLRSSSYEKKIAALSDTPNQSADIPMIYTKRLADLNMSAFLDFFISASDTSKSLLFEQSYDSRFITDYIFERIFNLNYIATLSMLWYKQATYHHFDLSTIKNDWNLFFNTMLGFLFFYPLPEFRISLSKFLWPYLTPTHANRLTISPYLNGFFFQTFVYFPLIDIVFTYLLRIFKKSPIEIYKDLKNSLCSNYQEKFIENKKLTLIQKVNPSPFARKQRLINSRDIENFYVDFLYQLFTDKNNFYLKTLSHQKKYNFEKLLYSCPSNGLSFDIENINAHVMDYYQLSSLKKILFPFSSEFIHLMYISQLNEEEGLKPPAD